MRELHTFKPAMGVRCPSPFGLKADALLAMSGLDYERVFSDVRKAPLKKFPVLKDGDALIADSSRIAAHLRKAYGFDPDAHLSPAERADALAYQRLVEEHLYYIGMYFRWIEEPVAIREGYFDELPRPMRNIVFSLVLRQVRRDLHGQGLGRHDRATLIEFARADFDALATRLGGNRYFMGDRISGIDATMLGALENAVSVDLDGPYREAVCAHDNLIAYCDRLRTEIFPDAARAG